MYGATHFRMSPSTAPGDSTTRTNPTVLNLPSFEQAHQISYPNPRPSGRLRTSSQANCDRHTQPARIRWCTYARLYRRPYTVEGRCSGSGAPLVGRLCLGTTYRSRPRLCGLAGDHGCRTMTEISLRGRGCAFMGCVELYRRLITKSEFPRVD